MISAENELVPLTPQAKIRGKDVEEWLIILEDSMRKSLNAQMKTGFIEYQLAPRKEWVTEPPSQIVICIGMAMWCFYTEEALSSQDSDTLAD
mmetsp:Transcript_26565/g.4676  ORF Transcript_26565/g.4676 Transcript_26565/m.4676 type:complete len:92 (+) Transcript_26565:1255-1530(+)